MRSLSPYEQERRRKTHCVLYGVIGCTVSVFVFGFLILSFAVMADVRSNTHHLFDKDPADVVSVSWYPEGFLRLLRGGGDKTGGVAAGTRADSSLDICWFPYVLGAAMFVELLMFIKPPWLSQFWTDGPTKDPNKSVAFDAEAPPPGMRLGDRRDTKVRVV